MLLVVGRIGRAHGVHGEATIEIRTDLPEERFVVGARLATDPIERGPLTIESLRDHNGILLLKFKEVDDRTSIEKLRDTLLISDVEMGQAQSISEDDFHVQQLIGCDVLLASGEKIGELTDVLNLPGQDVLAIATRQGEILLPFVLEFVPDIDLAGRKITITPPSGLLELRGSTIVDEEGSSDAL
jgi:16S rRNA processing protein RimM